MPDRGQFARPDLALPSRSYFQAASLFVDHPSTMLGANTFLIRDRSFRLARSGEQHGFAAVLALEEQELHAEKLGERGRAGLHHLRGRRYGGGYRLETHCAPSGILG
jgi:hypothetical protein